MFKTQFFTFTLKHSLLRFFFCFVNKYIYLFVFLRVFSRIPEGYFINFL